MKRYILSLLVVLSSVVSTHAMSYELAREEALYLTDKMAYELNLNEQQYEYAYEINLDYLLSLNTADDVYGTYLSYRNADLRAILYDWQWALYTAADYFYRPVYWRNGGWYYPIYTYYHHNHFYFSRPSIYFSYRGGHGRGHYHDSWYANRRPAWDGGYRGHDRNHFGGVQDSYRPREAYHGGSRMERNNRFGRNGGAFSRQTPNVRFGGGSRSTDGNSIDGNRGSRGFGRGQAGEAQNRGAMNGRNENMQRRFGTDPASRGGSDDNRRTPDRGMNSSTRETVTGSEMPQRRPTNGENVGREGYSPRGQERSTPNFGRESQGARTEPSSRGNMGAERPSQSRSSMGSQGRPSMGGSPMGSQGRSSMGGQRGSSMGGQRGHSRR